MSKNLPWFVEKFEDHDPEYFRLVKETVDKAMSPVELDEKTKYLVVLALDAYKGAAEGVKVVAKQAREAGATEQEIIEVLRLVYFVSGMDAIKNSLNAFD
ncbi:MAG: carboxymuconolactone decarboxylase family protein [Syntrophomonadaceae bacterium]|nr:carboxymuconolactone decarboxylase family protein [Syntrophomonadaceae bacterium]